MKIKTKIAVAMSGGVDSAVAAFLLKERGYDVTGVNLNLWSCFKTPKKKSCCSTEDRLDAMKVCEKLGIPFHTLDIREEFKEKVINHFVNEYAHGRTPIPCVSCNTHIKFKALLTWLERSLSIEALATGHYAQITRDDGTWHLRRGVDPKKDQSYFLFEMNRDCLKHLRFPLGSYTKEEIRKIAETSGLPVADKPESQEICFVVDGDVPSFIEDYHPEGASPGGVFVDTEGNILGRHRGIHAYTIGQRRGLRIGFGERKYVKEIRPETNEIVLGDNEELFSDSCRIGGLNILKGDLGEEFTADIKIRYATPPVPGTVSLVPDAGRGEIRFLKPVRAITPGQAAVFYKDNIVLGGGWIL